MRAFLSHSSADKAAYVSVVASRLGRDQIVFDEVTFEEGERSMLEIIRTMDQSDIFVLFLSDKSLNSEWVRQEIELANLRLSTGALKEILPIVIERGISHEDPRIPSWIRDNYNLRLVSRPVIAARKIHQKLRQASWSKHPKLRERQALFVGRNAQIEAFEMRFDDYSKERPVLSVVGGISSIGRKTLIRKAMEKLALARGDRAPPQLYLDRHASIEDFILQLLDVGVSVQTIETLALNERDLASKVELAISLLLEIAEFGDRIVVVDEGCLVNYQKELPAWFEAIVTDSRLAGSPLLFVAAKWSLRPLVARRLDRAVFSLALGELSDSERRRLFGRLVELEEIILTPEMFTVFANLLHGFPDEAQFAADLVARFGVRGALDRSHEIVEFNGEKATLLLSKFQDNAAALELVTLLAQSEIFSVEFLCEVFQEVAVNSLLETLVEEHVCEVVGAEGEFIRLIDSVRDHVKRNNLEIDPKLKEAIHRAVNDDIRKASWNEYDSSRVAFVVREALSSGARIEERYMIPSHILRAMKDLYHERGNLKRLVQLADTLLAKEASLSPDLIQDARYYLCLGLARSRDKRVLQEVQRITGAEHNFILGYYYRLVGRHKEAIERLESVTDAPFVEARAKRELVEVLLQIEQYDDARALAKRNYEGNKTNQYHVQAYLRALVLGSNPQAHAAEAKSLCDELDAIGSDKAKQMAMIGRAQIAARCYHSQRAIDLIDDAIAAFPGVIYPALAKFDIALLFRSEADMEDAITRLEGLAKEDRGVSPKTMLVQRASLKAFRGDLIGALKELDSTLNDYPDRARARIQERLRALAAG